MNDLATKPEDDDVGLYCDKLTTEASKETDKLLAGLRSIVSLVSRFGENPHGSGQRLRSPALAGPRGRAQG